MLLQCRITPSAKFAILSIVHIHKSGWREHQWEQSVDPLNTTQWPYLISNSHHLTQSLALILGVVLL